jgi:Rhamnan synthesis protein F
MPRYYLAYATVNDSWRFFRDLVNFRRLAALDPGVAQVDVFIGVSEAVLRRESDYRALAKVCRLADSNPRLRVRSIAFKPGAGGSFSAWSRCMPAIVEECSPDDYVLCLDRSAFGPLAHGWYARFVSQLEREPGIALCGNSISFAARVQPPGPEHAHVQSYAFMGKPHLLAECLACLPGLAAPASADSILNGEIALSTAVLGRGFGITSLAWPERVFFARSAYDSALPQGDISFDLTTTPYRHWRRGDYLAAGNLWLGFAGLLDLQRPGRATDSWAEWSASLAELFFLRLEEEIPASPLMSGSGKSCASTPSARNGDLADMASRIGVHVHLHFQDLWPEIRASLANLPRGFGLHVTTNDDNAALFDAIKAGFPGASITVVRNRGRDMGPFLALLNSGAFDRYDYVCKIHSKKSLVNGRESYFGRAWRRRSIADLLGTPAQIRAILSMFDADPSIGVVGSAVLRQPNRRLGAEDVIGRNQQTIDDLLSRCAGHRVTVPLDFFAGSMYWLRPPALQAVRSLAIAAEDFPEEPCKSDGTLAHALERMVPMSVVLSGYRISDAAQAFAGPAAMMQAQSAAS